MSHPTTAEFIARVEQGLAGTPYVVTPTEQGFDVSLDIVNAKWFDMLSKRGIEKAYTWHVKVTDAGHFIITDDSREVSWQAGIPTVSGQVKRTMGRNIQVDFEKSWGVREDGTFGKITDYSFNSEEGRGVITTVGKDLGLTPKRNVYENIGLYVGLFAIIGVIVMGLTTLIMKLMG